MRSTLSALLAILLLVPIIGCSGSKTAPSAGTGEEKTAEDFHPDPDLLGTWTIISSELDGEPNAAAIGNRFTFDGFQLELWMHRLGRLRVEYDLDTAQAPSQMDITLGKAPDEKLFRGIYELDGEKMKLCFRERVRPTEFGTAAGTGARFHVLERAVDQDKIR